MRNADERTAPRGWEGVLALILALAALWAAHSVLWAFPQWSMTDEPWCFYKLEKALNGHWELFLAWCNGSLALAAQALAARLFGPTLSVLHGVTLLALVLEHALLFRLARQRWGREAAWAAVLASALAASTVLRAHAFTAHAFMPLLALLCLWLAPQGRLGALLGGLLLGLGFADYEGWLAGWAALTAFLILDDKDRRPAWGPWILGAALGLGVVVWASWDILVGWVEYRSQTRAQVAVLQPTGSLLWRNLSALFYSGDHFAPYLHLTRHGWWAWWAWPLLGAGLWVAFRRERALLLWPAMALAVLAVPSGSPEPNRALAAWPGLALLAGLGWRQLRQGPLASPLRAWLLPLVAAGGFVVEAAAHRSHALRYHAWYYGESASVLAYLDAYGPQLRDGRLRVLSRLHVTGPVLRLQLRGAPAAKPGALTHVLLPQGALPELAEGDGQLLKVRRFEGQPEDLWVLQVGPGREARFEAIERFLEEFDDQRLVARVQHRRQLTQALAQQKDPLLQASLWTDFANLAGPVGAFGRAEAAAMLSAPFKGSQPFPGLCLTLNNRGEDPWLAWRLLQEYHRRDPQAARPPEVQAILDLRPPSPADLPPVLRWPPTPTKDRR